MLTDLKNLCFPCEVRDLLCVGKAALYRLAASTPALFFEIRDRLEGFSGDDECIILWRYHWWYSTSMFGHQYQNFRELTAIPAVPVSGEFQLQKKT